MIASPDLAPVVPVDAAADGSARTRRMVRHVAEIGGGIGASMVTNLLLVPVLYRYLGREAFGVWALLVSIQVILAAVDPGNSLVHHLTAVLAIDDRPRAARLVGASLVLTTGVALVLVVVYGAASLFVDWAQMWNVGGNLAPDARAATTVLVLAVALGLPATLVDKLNLARQAGGRNGALNAVVAMTTLLTALGVVRLGGGLAAVVAATTMPAVVIRTGWLGVTLARDPRIRPTGFVDGSVRLLLRASAAFAVLQVCAVVSFTGNQFIVARILGPVAVADYAVPAKAFAILLAASAATTTALWPAFLEAVARYDVRWVRAEARRVLGWSGVMGVLFGSALVVFGPRVLSAWVGGGYGPDRRLLVAFACWGVIYLETNALGVILLALGSLRRLVALGALSTTVNVGASVLLTRRIGLSGVVWGSVLGSLVVSAVPLWLMLRHGMDRLSTAKAAEVGGADHDWADPKVRSHHRALSPTWTEVT